MKAWGQTLAVGMLAIPAALLAQTGTGTGNGQSYARVNSLSQIETNAQRWYADYNQVVGDFNSVRSSAANYELELVNDGLKRNQTFRANPPSSLQTYTPITNDKMVSYLPQALIRDINTRILREFYRGHSEWKAGMYPPQAYYGYSADTRNWTRLYFDQWDYNGGFTWISRLDPLNGIEVEALGNTGGAGDPARYIGEARQAVQGAVGPVRDLVQFRADIATTTGGWRNNKTYRTLRNEGEFNTVKASAERALTNAKNRVASAGQQVTGGIRRAVEDFIQYRGGDMPYIGLGGTWYNGTLFGASTGFTSGTGNGNGYQPWNNRSGTGNGYDSQFSRFRSGNHYNFGGTYVDTRDRMGLWTLLFDNQVLTAIPDKYRAAVQSRMIRAYFRGAKYAKYNADFVQPGSGNGWGYNDYTYTWRNGTGNGRSSTYGSGTGTGNGYSGSYGSTRYRTGTGNGRTSQSWNSGTGNGTGTNGTGTGGGYNNGTGTGTGNSAPSYDDIFGGNNGTGGGSYNGSGTGTGSGSTYTPRPSTGTGGGSTYTPRPSTGTGTGSGNYGGGTGTGTGGGSNGGGTGTGTGSGY